MSEQEIIESHPGTPIINRHPSMQGPGNPRWNGGASEYQDHYLLKKVRIEKLKSIRGKCEICGERARMVHHIDETTSNHDLSNLLAVCHPCHRILHNIEEGGCKTSKYIRIYGVTLRELASITKLNCQTIQLWTEHPKRRDLLIQALQDKGNAQAIVRKEYYKRETGK